MAQTYDAIASYTFGSAASSYTFSSIAASWTDLILVISGTGDSGGYVGVQLGNGSADTGTHYSRTWVYGNGTSAGSNRVANETAWYMDAGSGSSTTPSSTVLQIMNYANTTTYKTSICRVYSYLIPGPAAFVYLWRGATGSSTEAINTIKINGSGSSTIQSGTTMSLYGIKAA